MRGLRWARNLLGRKNTEKTVRIKPLANYSPELIDELKSEHDELLKQYDEIEQAAATGRYASVSAMLAAFKTRFTQHILSKDLHLYGFLDRQLRKSPAKFARVQDFHDEMTATARRVLNLVKKYRMAGVRLANGPEFLMELREVGARLRQSMEHEEREIYPLYQP